MCTVPVHGFADVRPSISRLDGCSEGEEVLSGTAQDTYQGSYCLIGHDKTQKKRERKTAEREDGHGKAVKG